MLLFVLVLLVMVLHMTTHLVVLHVMDLPAMFASRTIETVLGVFAIDLAGVPGKSVATLFHRGLEAFGRRPGAWDRRSSHLTRGVRGTEFGQFHRRMILVRYGETKADCGRALLTST